MVPVLDNLILDLAGQGMRGVYGHNMRQRQKTKE